jgi:hypothetical protein
VLNLLAGVDAIIFCVLCDFQQRKPSPSVPSSPPVSLEGSQMRTDEADKKQVPYEVLKRAATLLVGARQAEQRGSLREAERLRGGARRLLPVSLR